MDIELFEGTELFEELAYFDEIDIYSEEKLANLEDDDLINPTDRAFMEGYLSS